MKVDVKTNQLMRRITFISIMVTFLIFILQFNYPGQFILQAITAFIYIRLSWYLISVLQFAGESINIQNPFSILLGINILSFISTFAAIGEFALPFSVLICILSIYISFITFQIKNPLFSKVYKFYGASLVLTILTKVFLSFEIVQSSSNKYPIYLSFITLANVLPLYAVLSITRKVNTAFQENPIPV